jgi:hypothetical protein
MVMNILKAGGLRLNAAIKNAGLVWYRLEYVRILDKWLYGHCLFGTSGWQGVEYNGCGFV